MHKMDSAFHSAPPKILKTLKTLNIEERRRRSETPIQRSGRRAAAPDGRTPPVVPAPCERTRSKHSAQQLMFTAVTNRSIRLFRLADPHPFSAPSTPTMRRAASGRGVDPSPPAIPDSGRRGRGGRLPGTAGRIKIKAPSDQLGGKRAPPTPTHPRLAAHRLPLTMQTNGGFLNIHTRFAVSARVRGTDAFWECWRGLKRVEKFFLPSVFRITELNQKQA